MTTRRTTFSSDPSRALATVLADDAELPRGAVRVLDRVFWRRGPTPRSEGRVIPLPTRPVREPDPSTSPREINEEA